MFFYDAATRLITGPGVGTEGASVFKVADGAGQFEIMRLLNFAKNAYEAGKRAESGRYAVRSHSQGRRRQDATVIREKTVAVAEQVLRLMTEKSAVVTTASLQHAIGVGMRPLRAALELLASKHAVERDYYGAKHVGWKLTGLVSATPEADAAPTDRLVEERAEQILRHLRDCHAPQSVRSLRRDVGGGSTPLSAALKALEEVGAVARSALGYTITERGAQELALLPEPAPIEDTPAPAPHVNAFASVAAAPSAPITWPLRTAFEQIVASRDQEVAAAVQVAFEPFVLDATSAAAFEHAIEHPRAPTEALVQLMREGVAHTPLRERCSDPREALLAAVKSAFEFPPPGWLRDTSDEDLDAVMSQYRAAVAQLFGCPIDEIDAAPSGPDAVEVIWTPAPDGFQIRPEPIEIIWPPAEENVS